MLRIGIVVCYHSCVVRLYQQVFDLMKKKDFFATELQKTVAFWLGSFPENVIKDKLGWDIGVSAILGLA